MSGFSALVKVFSIHPGLSVGLPLICRLAGRQLKELTLRQQKEWFESVPTEEYMARLYIAVQTGIPQFVRDSLSISEDGELEDQPLLWLRQCDILLKCLALDHFEMVNVILNYSWSSRWVGREIRSGNAVYSISMWKINCKQRTEFMRITRTEQTQYGIKSSEWSEDIDDCCNSSCPVTYHYSGDDWRTLIYRGPDEIETIIWDEYYDEKRNNKLIDLLTIQKLLHRSFAERLIVYFPDDLALIIMMFVCTMGVTVRMNNESKDTADKMVTKISTASGSNVKIIVKP